MYLSIFHSNNLTVMGIALKGLNRGDINNINTHTKKQSIVKNPVKSKDKTRVCQNF